MDAASFNGFENIFAIESDMVAVQKIKILALKRLFPVMRLLILDVARYAAQIRVGDRKCSKPFLPRKTTADPFLLVNVIGRSGFNVSNKIRQGDIRLQTHQDMNVVGHAINGDQFLALFRDNAGYVFL